MEPQLSKTTVVLICIPEVHKGAYGNMKGQNHVPLYFALNMEQPAGFVGS